MDKLKKANIIGKASWWLLGIANVGVLATIGYVAIFTNQTWEWWLCYIVPVILFTLGIDGIFIFINKIGKDI